MLKFFKSAGTLFKSLPSIILFELIYKLLLTAIAAPVLMIFFNLAIKLSGVGYLTGANMGKFFSNPYVILITFVILIGIALVTLAEISAIIACLAGYQQKIKIGLTGMFYTAYKTSLKMFRGCNILMIPYILLILPLTQLTAASGLVSSIGLNRLNIFSKIPEINYIIEMYLLVLIVIALFLVSRIYSLHFFTLTKLPFTKCVKKSREITKGKRIKLAASIILWNIFITVICGVTIFAVSFLVVYVIKGFSQPQNAAAMALKIIGYIVKGVMIISSIFAAPVIFAFITSCFFSETSTIDISEIQLKKPEIKPFKRRIAISLVIGLSVFLNYSYLKNLSQENIKLNIGFLNRTKITAHRGASVDAPENTSYSFLAAIEQKADYIEFDVQQTADGQIVVFHDENLKRITGTNKNLRSLTYDELKELDYGSWFGEEFADAEIMLLSDVLELIGDDIKLNIEIKAFSKASETAAATAEIVKEYGYEDSCYITSFSYSALKAVKKSQPEIKTGIITNLMTYNSYTKLKYIDAISINKNFVTQSTVNTAHINGKRIFVWTVNTPAEMDHFITLGVDNIITDRPSVGVEAVYSEGTEGYILSILSWIFN